MWYWCVPVFFSSVASSYTHIVGQLQPQQAVVKLRLPCPVTQTQHLFERGLVWRHHGCVGTSDSGNAN